MIYVALYEKTNLMKADNNNLRIASNENMV